MYTRFLEERSPLEVSKSVNIIDEERHTIEDAKKNLVNCVRVATVLSYHVIFGTSDSVLGFLKKRQKYAQKERNN